MVAAHPVPTLMQLRAAASAHRPLRVQVAGARPAAVLVPLIPTAQGLHLLFTERSARLRSHAGQVSFPGGSIDPCDAGAQAAALREAEEEVGLDPAHVEILGQLDDCPTFVTGYVISPFVGLLHQEPLRDGRYPWRPSPHEIAHLHELPLADFCDPANRRTEVRQHGSATYELHWYTVRETVIWGATARILKQLIDLALAH